MDTVRWILEHRFYSTIVKILLVMIGVLLFITIVQVLRGKHFKIVGVEWNGSADNPQADTIAGTKNYHTQGAGSPIIEEGNYNSQNSNNTEYIGGVHIGHLDARNNGSVIHIEAEKDGAYHPSYQRHLGYRDVDAILSQVKDILGDSKDTRLHILYSQNDFESYNLCDEIAIRLGEAGYTDVLCKPFVYGIDAGSEPDKIKFGVQRQGDMVYLTVLPIYRKLVKKSV